MVKLIGLLKRKAGMTRQSFRDYYETKHAPLARRILPMPGDYRRNYPTVVRSEGKEVAGEPDYDVVTELWFDSEADYELFSKAMQDPETRALIVEDEERFLDRSKSRIMIVDECRSRKD